MLRDVFYYGEKPNAHPRERFATSLEEAKKLSTTEHFWIINEFCDYRNFDWDWDFDFLADEDVWAEDHNNVWPSHYQKDSGTWLCSINLESYTIYRADVDPIPRKNIVSKNWLIPDNIDKTKFDFQWHPDPSDPPYIYQFGTQWQKSGGPRYIVDGATDIKYMDSQIAVAVPEMLRWKMGEKFDASNFDFTWHPDDSEDEVYIYQFGTQWQKTGGPRYVPKNAKNDSPVKYLNIMKVKVFPNKNFYKTLVRDIEFDYSWHPDDTEPPYIYIFGNNQYPGEIMPTVMYSVPNAKHTKYVTDIVATLKPNKDNWVIVQNINEDKFDYSWRPNPKDPPYIYVWGNKYIDGKIKSTIEYHVPGATDYKYMSELVEVAPEWDRWTIPDNIDKDSFDFTWRPNPTDADFIWQFGTQHQKTNGPTYTVQGATEIKYTDYLKAVRVSNKEDKNWHINIPVESFDFSWHPDETEEPFIYVFGNQWNDAVLEPTVEYRMPGATQKKYISDIIATVAENKDRFEIIEEIESFDFSWRPNPTDPPLTYIFGSKQYSPTIMPVIKYVTEDGAPNKFMDITALLAQKPELFINKDYIEKFDYSWRPNPTDPPYIYQFGTQWAKTHGPIYVVEGATEVKFVDDVKAIVKPNMSYWEIPEGVNISTFDFSWHPDATSPPYIYQFGTIVDENDGPRYITPNNNGEVVSLERLDKNVEVKEFPRYYINTSLEDLIKQHPDEVFWALNPDMDYSEFNFDWRPDIQQINYVHAFGTEENINTQTYFVNAVSYNQGHTDINYIKDDTLEIKTRIDMFFIDRSNVDSEKHFKVIKTRFPYVQKTRYLNSWVETISRCLKKSTTKLVWILNSELDYSTFEFDYYPNPWQMKMIHVFGTQYSHWGTTFMVNKESFDEDTKYVKIIEHLAMLNFVKNRKANAVNCLYDMYVIDHGNEETIRIVNQLKDKVVGKNLSIIKYNKNYLETFKDLLKMIPERKEHYIWVASSICDYSNFDFKYICDPFSKDQLHVFPSEKQKFGDTFLVDVNRLRILIEDMDTLEDYKKVNYNQHMRVKRLPCPTIITEGDTHVSAIHSDFNWPYITFQTSDNKELQVIDHEPMSLWDEKHKNIIVNATGGTRIIVPKEAKDYVKKELYDYPYIVKNFRQAESKPLDIVFLSNGETGADENYEHLLNVTNGLPNKVTRVDGVNGRVAAYHAAAEASETPWMFTVFAKLKVNKNFDWSWQPDRLQVPKHYIFHATNPVNKLVYGHQAMIAYNKKITLANTGRGLDFTLDDEHEVVEINSGVALYNTDEWSTWRTAFREAIKLVADTSEISKHRLKIWLTVAEGDFAQYSLQGANDAVEYYEEVKGDLNKLKLSYDWVWLRERFTK